MLEHTACSASTLRAPRSKRSSWLCTTCGALSLLADALSMGIGDALSSKAEKEVAVRRGLSELAEEYDRVAEQLNEEIEILSRELKTQLREMLD